MHLHFGILRLQLFTAKKAAKNNKNEKPFFEPLLLYTICKQLYTFGF